MKQHYTMNQNYKYRRSHTASPPLAHDMLPFKIQDAWCGSSTGRRDW